MTWQSTDKIHGLVLSIATNEIIFLIESLRILLPELLHRFGNCYGLSVYFLGKDRKVQLALSVGLGCAHENRLDSTRKREMIKKAQHPQNRIKSILFLQALVILFTFSGVFGKLATQGNAFMSPEFLWYVFLDIAVLGVYALFWQQALKRFDLHVAYANRAMATVWGLLWAALLFKEIITVMNVLGTVCILGGTLLVNTNGE